MTAVGSGMPTWVGLDDQDAINRHDPSWYIYKQVVDAINHINVDNQRVLFNQYTVSQTTTTGALYQFRYNDDATHLRTLQISGIVSPSTAAAALGTVTNSITAAAVSVPTYTPTAITEPGGSFEVTDGGLAYSPSGAYRAGTITTANNLVLTGACVTQYAVTADTSYAGAQPVPYAAGLPILDAHLEELRAAIHALWRTHRRVLVACCVPTTVTNSPFALDSTTDTNILDGTTTARSASTAGFITPARYAGFGTDTSVATKCAVYGRMSGATADTGQATFTSSLGSRTITGITGTTNAWYADAGTLSIDTTIEYDKVDVMAKKTTDTDATKVEIYAVMIMEDPASP